MLLFFKYFYIVAVFYIWELIHLRAVWWFLVEKTQFPVQKFLGIVIYEKLSFEEHIKPISKNSLKGLNVMKCLAGISWGADSKILLILHKSIIRSNFDYSSLADMNSNYINRLDILQNRVLRIISSAMCSTPIRAMEMESKIMPVILSQLLLAERYCL